MGPFKIIIFIILMKKLSSLLLLFFSFTLLKANNIDSLRNIANAIQGEAKAKKLNEFSAFLVSKKQLKDAQILADEALISAENTGAKNEIAAANENLALISIENFDNSSAGKYLNNALKIRELSKDHQAIVKNKILLGRVFLAQEDFESATQQLTRAIELSRSAQNKIGEAEASKYLGDTYASKKIFGKAKDNYKQAMDIFLEAGEPQKAADLASNLGNIVTELGDYDGAITYYQTSLDLNTSTNNLQNIARDLTNVAKMHGQQGNFDESKRFCEMAMGLHEQQKNTIGQAQVLVVMAKNFADKGDKTAATTQLENAANLSQTVSSQPGVQNVFLDIATSYKSLGNLEKAFEFMNLYSKSKETIAAAEKNKSLIEMTARFENEFASRQKEQQISMLELEKSNGQKKIWMLIMFACALAGGGILAYKNYKVKKQDNLLLEAKNDEITEKNMELDDKNEILVIQSQSLEAMNDKLRHEMAEREAIEKSTFDKDSFLLNVSNQMRTPINVISGLSHLLLDQAPNPNQLEHLRTLQFSANSLLVFINDMLDYSKIEAGKLNPEFRVFEPSKLFTEITERFEVHTQQKGIKLNFNISEGIPNKISGDPARLNQILTNILQFSTHTTEKGYIDVKIEPIPISSTDLHLELTITDSGYGITQLEMDDLMRKFSYTIEDISGGMSQTGFGLAIMKRLVELQNGTVEASSVEGLGTKIRVVLPFKLIVQQPKTSNLDYAFPGAKVLVVEDNKINAMVVSKMLQKAHVQVETAINGIFALEKIAKEDFDLILMDIQMPEMDGYRCTSEIRKLTDTNKKDTPIIALTASPYLTETEKAKLFGMNDYIGKPFSADELMEKVGKYLQVEYQYFA
jgi:signal transduction histidine kinase/tetratricopeptide (TPR) repeat protein/ActR/RegA family two-component response regulator